MREIPQKPSLRKKRSSKFKKLFSEDEREQEKNRIKRSKVLTAINSEDFHTDDSMAGIQYNDVKSD